MRMLAAAALTTVVVGMATESAEAGLRRTMVRAISYVRSFNHRGTLHFSRRLSGGAAAWARHLVQADVLAHSARAISQGDGEIIEWHTGGRARIGRVVAEWLHSREHRVVMMTRGYRRAGAGRAVGYMNGRRCTIWVVRFAR